MKPKGEPVPTAGRRAPREVRRAGARLIRQAYEVDPLLWSQCGGRMKVIAVIERPAVVRQILDHPREWSYEPCFDNLPVPDPMLG
jgi:hypothetical protein